MKILIFLLIWLSVTSVYSVENKKAIKLNQKNTPESKANSTNKQDVYEYDNRLTIYKNPIDPPDYFTRGFVPEDAEHITTVDLHQQILYTSSEVMFLFHTKETMDNLLHRYEVLFKEKDLRILQKEKKDKNIILLTETISKRLVTISIEEKDTFRKVKLFYRNPLANAN